MGTYRRRILWLVPAVGIGAIGTAVLVGGTPSVEAAPGPNAVIVTNTPLPVRPSTDVFRFSSLVGASFENTSGELIVIDEFSAISSVRELTIETTGGNPAVPYFYYLAGAGPFNASNDYLYQATPKIFLLPGEQLNVFPGVLGYTLSGHYEPAP